jgi:methyl-accepting chemotaxis protein
MALSLRDLKKTIKDLWTAVSNRLRVHKLLKTPDCQFQIDDEGFISQEADATRSFVTQPANKSVDKQIGETSTVALKAVEPTAKQESLEKFQEGFNKLIEQLQGINEHLNRQIAQQRDLMSRVEQLPQLLESFPAVVENQKQIVEELLGQLRATAAKQQQFVDAVEKMPGEIGRQTDALVDIDHQLAAAADTDVQMAESFNKFNETLGKLNESTVGQSDSITQMSKTFATSDRYLKYILSRQNRRFVWVFVAAVGVCVAVILIFAGIIIYLRW